MSDYLFTVHQRYAVFTCHGEKCYMCKNPLDLLTMEIDHVIPEHLEGNPDEFAKVKTKLGRSAHFQINSYENWLPSCHRCNNTKRGTPFDPSGLVQIYLQNAAAKAEEVNALAEKTLSRRTTSIALNTIQRAPESLTREEWEFVRDFAIEHSKARQPEMTNEPMRLTPSWEVMSDNGLIRNIRGPFGFGSEPSTKPHPSFRCGVCGGTAWNGARCIRCGNLDVE